MPLSWEIMCGVISGTSFVISCGCTCGVSLLLQQGGREKLLVVGLCCNRTGLSSLCMVQTSAPSVHLPSHPYHWTMQCCMTLKSGSEGPQPSRPTGGTLPQCTTTQSYRIVSAFHRTQLVLTSKQLHSIIPASPCFHIKSSSVSCRPAATESKH